MNYLILAESELELIPEEIRRHKQVTGYARYVHKSTENILLDSSLFFRAMAKLPESERRGRPDIVHFSLLLALDSPACRRGELQVFVHARNDRIIRIENETRLPKNYSRFVGLMEQLFQTGKVPPEGKLLLSLEKKSLKELLAELKPKRTVLLHQLGHRAGLEEMKGILSVGEVALIVGGFPHGDFHPGVLPEIPEEDRVSISEHEHLAYTVIAFLLAAMG